MSSLVFYSIFLAAKVDFKIDRRHLRKSVSETLIERVEDIYFGAAVRIFATLQGSEGSSIDEK